MPRFKIPDCPDINDSSQHILNDCEKKSNRYKCYHSYDKTKSDSICRPCTYNVYITICTCCDDGDDDDEE